MPSSGLQVARIIIDLGTDPNHQKIRDRSPFIIGMGISTNPHDPRGVRAPSGGGGPCTIRSPCAGYGVGTHSINSFIISSFPQRSSKIKSNIPVFAFNMLGRERDLVPCRLTCACQNLITSNITFPPLMGNLRKKKVIDVSRFCL